MNQILKLVRLTLAGICGCIAIYNITWLAGSLAFPEIDKTPLFLNIITAAIFGALFAPKPDPKPIEKGDTHEN